MTIVLNDGTNLTVTSNNVSPGPFTGFISDVPITSLTVTGVSNTTFRWATIDNLYVGIAATPVPFEFSPAFGLGVLGTVWLGHRVLKRKV